MADKVSITIEKYRIHLDPEVCVYHVEVARGDGVWEETCPTREHLEMFLQGVRAGCESYVTLPEIPERAEPLPETRVAPDDVPTSTPIRAKGRGPTMSEITAVRYLTDDRDARRRNELVIWVGGNGDWYVAVVPEGEGTIGRAVRICTSGGASSKVPGLTVAIANAFRALANVAGEDITHETRS